MALISNKRGRLKLLGVQMYAALEEAGLCFAHLDHDSS